MTSKQLGRHAVKIIGWGTEDHLGNCFYGHFKIVRGIDECGIEPQAVNGGHVTYYSPTV